MSCWQVAGGREKRSRNMKSQGPGCTSAARKLGGLNLRRGRGDPARHRKANNERRGCQRHVQSAKTEGCSLIVSISIVDSIAMRAVLKFQ
jgi:hypothetical protein